jgi:SPX domain protein involved in polyphosphate accumulation
MTYIQDARREIKFSGAISSKRLIEAWLNTSVGHFREHHPDRYVRSVYFDTPTLDSYVSNVAGISKRMKVRYRWYGEQIDPQQGKLEIKTKLNSLGWKTSLEMGYPVTSGVKFEKQLADIKIPNFNLSMYDCYKCYALPVVTIGYKRKYFISRDGNVRATIDTDIFYSRQFGKPRYSEAINKFYKEQCILEIKCPHEYGPILPTQLEGVPLRITKNSKYVNAVNAFL